ncbi:class I SAM-dependent methyltransferase [Thermodesulfobacteriota bacterium]
MPTISEKAGGGNIDFESADLPCPACHSKGMSIFFQQKAIPSNSCILLPSREEAIGYPNGDLSLGFCPECGFISNTAFNPELTEYSSRYEETQGFSSTFSSFQYKLAEKLVSKYDLHGKDILEIGCGKGEFLTLLCEIGDNRGVGFDPAYISERKKSGGDAEITFIEDFYAEKYSNYSADFIACKMTLEHIHKPFDFVSMIRRSIGDRPDTVVFFQVPDVTRIVRDCAFEDIYYEHCSYFSPGSLSRLLGRCGFDLLNLETTYNGQYLIIEARPGVEETEGSRQEDDLERITLCVREFPARLEKKLSFWNAAMKNFNTRDKRVVIWGSGSKGVSFLTALEITEEIEYAVDINPHRTGFFMPGNGQKIVAIDFLKGYEPDIVIIMNPIYRQEIQDDLDNLNIRAELLTVDSAH